MTQTDLFSKTHAERFASFHREHPEVFSRLAWIALEMRARGRKVSIRDAWGYLRITMALRWEADDEGYKLNNSLCAYYARELIRQHPELDGTIQTRAQRHEG